MRLLKTFVFVSLALCARVAAAQAPDRGVPVERVVCADDPSQTYALYLPSAYTPERQWSVIFAFHPAARGPLMVEKFRAAAEQYGYIVAASNNSRNGPHAVSAAAAQAMSADVGRRFSIDPQRVYLAGMSGGARVATGIALANTLIAGVIASSAGFPDSRPRTTVPFAVFAHRGHRGLQLHGDAAARPPAVIAAFSRRVPRRAIRFRPTTWRSTRSSGWSCRPCSQAGGAGTRRWLRGCWRSGASRIAASTDVAETVYLLRAVVEDFKGLLDVSAERPAARGLLRQSDVKKALKSERDSDDAEARMLGEIFTLEAQLGDDERDDRADDASRAPDQAVPQGGG